MYRLYNQDNHVLISEKENILILHYPRNENKGVEENKNQVKSGECKNREKGVPINTCMLKTHVCKKYTINSCCGLLLYIQS